MSQIRLVTVPVQRLHLPRDLRAGTAVDLYVTPKAVGGSTGEAPPPRLVLEQVVVDGTINDNGAGAGGMIGVILRVPGEAAHDVVTALQEGQLDLVKVPAAATGTRGIAVPSTPAPSISPPAS